MASTASLPPPGSAVPNDHYHSDETAAEYSSPDHTSDHTSNTSAPRPPWRAAAVAAAALGSRLRNSLYEYYDLS